MDRNPRYFVLHVEEITTELNTGEGHDMVEIEFAGRVTPTVRDRFKTALAEGNFAFSEKKLAG